MLPVCLLCGACVGRGGSCSFGVGEQSCACVVMC